MPEANASLPTDRLNLEPCSAQQPLYCPERMKQPKNPFHPGEILVEEFLNPARITQVAFARKLGWTPARLNELINGKRGVTAESALDLSQALGTSAKLWMNLQATYDLDQAEKRRKAA